jgi:hypothetical protein
MIRNGAWVTMTTFWAGGIVEVSPQKLSDVDGDGVGVGLLTGPVVRTANSQSE